SSDKKAAQFLKAKVSTTKDTSFPIVGIGASAGGLKVLEKMLQSKEAKEKSGRHHRTQGDRKCSGEEP
ncbi:MAG: hypothetical protein NTY16_06050, partial [Deltaproteobacteria bacterium]|nr:hypothetical protein [Deltaproteobacteria bacterium]